MSESNVVIVDPTSCKTNYKNTSNIKFLNRFMNVSDEIPKMLVFVIKLLISKTNKNVFPIMESKRIKDFL